jgi:hypothetical protein
VTKLPEDKTVKSISRPEAARQKRLTFFLDAGRKKNTEDAGKMEYFYRAASDSKR